MNRALILSDTEREGAAEPHDRGLWCYASFGDNHTDHSIHLYTLTVEVNHELPRGQTNTNLHLL